MDTTRFRTQTRQLKRENYKKGVLPQAIGNAEGTPAHGNFDQGGHRRLQSEDAVLATTAPMLCIVSSANASVNIPARPGSGSVLITRLAGHLALTHVNALGERHPIGETLNVIGMLHELTSFKMANAMKSTLPVFELVHAVAQQSGIRNQLCRCHQKLAAGAGYFCPISIHPL